MYVERRFSEFKKLYFNLKPFIDDICGHKGGMKNSFPERSVFSEICCCCFTNVEDKLNTRLYKLNVWLKEICLESELINNKIAFAILSEFLRDEK